MKFGTVEEARAYQSALERISELQDEIIEGNKALIAQQEELQRRAELTAAAVESLKEFQAEWENLPVDTEEMTAFQQFKAEWAASRA